MIVETRTYGARCDRYEGSWVLPFHRGSRHIPLHARFPQLRFVTFSIFCRCWLDESATTTRDRLSKTACHSPREKDGRVDSPRWDPAGLDILETARYEMSSSRASIRQHLKNSRQGSFKKWSRPKKAVSRLLPVLLYGSGEIPAALPRQTTQ
jgi:hypothetical protein